MSRFKAFLDTNILLDAYIDSRPYSEEANLILYNGFMNDFDLYISASQITDFVFIAGRGGEGYTTERAIEWLKNYTLCFTIADTTGKDILNMIHSDWKDYEDYLVYTTALRYGCEVLISRNNVVFSKAVIPVLDEHEFFDWYEKNYNIRYCFAELASLAE